MASYGQAALPGAAVPAPLGLQNAGTLWPLALGFLGPVGAAAGLLGAGYLTSKKTQADQGKVQALMQQFIPSGDVTKADLPSLLNLTNRLEQLGYSSPSLMHQADLLTAETQATRQQQDAVDLQNMTAQQRLQAQDIAYRQGMTQAQFQEGEANARSAAQLGMQQAQLQQQLGTARNSAISGMRDDLKSWIEPIAKMAANVQSIRDMKPGVARDQELVYGFARMISGGGTLSETDVSAVAGDPSVPGTLRRAIAHWMSGEMTPYDRGQLENAMATNYRKARDMFREQVQPYQNAATRLGLPWDEVVNPDILIPDEDLQSLEAGYIPPLSELPAPAAPAGATAPDGSPVLFRATLGGGR